MGKSKMEKTKKEIHSVLQTLHMHKPIANFVMLWVLNIFSIKSQVYVNQVLLVSRWETNKVLL